MIIKRDIVVFTYENFSNKIKKVLMDSETDYLFFLYLGNEDEKNNYLLQQAKKYFYNNYSKNNVPVVEVFIISTKNYLANDLGVRGVLNIKDITNFKFQNFLRLFKFSDISPVEFLLKNQEFFQYQLDLYKDNFWIYKKNNVVIMNIEASNYNIIFDNYHKLKNLIPDIIIIYFNGNDDQMMLKLLKLISYDSHIILGIMNKPIQYTKWTDAFIFINSQEYIQIWKNFINHFIDNNDNSLEKLREFLGIPQKNFDADWSYDEKYELNKKIEKYLSLEVKPSITFKPSVNVVNKNLIFNTGIGQEYTLKFN